MDNMYGGYFFTEFFEGHTGNDYNNRNKWFPFFDHIAAQIIERFNPKTVLDAGCAMGYLVEALRKRGVEAYGFDVAEYAISRVAEEVKPYCVVHSITEELPDSLPKTFDLITTIEVLEHLHPEDGTKAIKNLCQYSDTIIFTSQPHDLDNITHVNVQQQEYWCKEFAKHSFFKDHIVPVDFICEHAMLFRKRDSFEDVVFDYEIYDRLEKQKLKNLLTEKESLSVTINEMQHTLSDKLSDAHNSLAQWREAFAQEKSELNGQIDELKAQLFEVSFQNEHNQETVEKMYLQNERMKVAYKDLATQYNIIANAQWWKITKPMRVICTQLKRAIRNRYTVKVAKGLRYLRKNGISETVRKIRCRKNFLKSKFILSSQELAKQKATVFENDIKFSVIVPLYNTPKKFLKEMIDSVQKQTYSNWELCLADGSDAEHRYVEQICTSCAQKDNRVKYKKLAQNGGISENTNECLYMATGEYIALFDHDDLLHPSALFENAKAINEKDADFIYSDEFVFKGSLNNIIGTHFKPDFAIDHLRANNYICHFTVFKKDLLKESGLFRKEFDGSQDHDMTFRLVEKAKCIVHIPKVLYFWRSHAASVAGDISSKTYAITAGINAVRAHLERCGLKATVESSEACPTIYRIKYEIIGNPLISILIPNKGQVSTLAKCINSIFAKSTYENFEVIIIENNSEKTETFEYYNYLEKKYPNVRVVRCNTHGKFNYSTINNYGATFAKGEHLLFLNNDVEVISENWLEEMLMYSQREDVGAVGAKLYYPDDTIQHAGVIIGIGDVAGHSHRHFPRNSAGFLGRLSLAQSYSAVTAACLMMKADIFNKINGFDEAFEVAYNDVDICLRIRKLGYLITWTPYAELYHYESKSRGSDTENFAKQMRSKKEINLFNQRWSDELERGDPYYNPNLTLDREDFSIKLKDQ